MLLFSLGLPEPHEYHSWSWSLQRGLHLFICSVIASSVCPDGGWNMLPLYCSSMSLAVSWKLFTDWLPWIALFSCLTVRPKSSVFFLSSLPLLNAVVLLAFVLLSITASLYRNNPLWRNNEYPLKSPIAEINSLVTFSKTSQPQKHRCSLDQYPQFPDKKKTVGMFRPLGGTLEKERMTKTLYTTTASLSF